MIYIEPALVALMNALLIILDSKDYNLYATLLEKVKIKQMSVSTLLTLLRISSSVKDRIPNWHWFLNEVDKEFNNRGLDSDKQLIGLKC